MKARTKSHFIVVGLLLVALVQPCWPLALTTFGKSSPQNNNNKDNNDNKQSAERAQARECVSDSECAGIKGTSCLENIFSKDNKLRCLCGDYREPRNGLCDNQYRGVQVQCNSNEECIPGAQCIVGNSTNLLGRRCYCMQGFVADEDMQCSGGLMAVGFSALSLMASLLLAGNV